jgi:hypothetical protein
METTALKDGGLLGLEISFEDENGDPKWKRLISTVRGDKVYVRGPRAIEGWYDLADLETN